MLYFNTIEKTDSLDIHLFNNLYYHKENQVVIHRVLFTKFRKKVFQSFIAMAIKRFN